MAYNMTRTQVDISTLKKEVKHLKDLQNVNIRHISSLRIKCEALTLPFSYGVYRTKELFEFKSKELFEFLEPFMEQLLSLSLSVFSGEITPSEGERKSAEIIQDLEETAKRKGISKIGES